MNFFEQLTESELSDFRKKVKIELIQRDLEIEDLKYTTGYSDRTLRRVIEPSARPSKFLILAVAEQLDIDLSTLKKG